MPSNAFETLHDLAKLKTERALTEFSRLLSSELSALDKLKMLQDYRDEYQSRLDRAREDGLGVPALQNYQSFLLRMDMAIAEQSRAAEFATGQKDAGKQKWIDARAKESAYHTLLKREQSRIDALAQRRDQKILDEFASRAVRRTIQSDSGKD